MSKKRGTNVPDQPTVPPMPNKRRYIDESKLIEKLHVGEGLPTISRSVLVNCVLPTIPTADVRENVHGFWYALKKGDRGYSAGDFCCSVCKEPNYTWIPKPNFCPNCGADMRRES